MNDSNTPKPTDAERIAALEAELKRVKFERDIPKETV